MQTQFVILLITPDLMDHIHISPNVNYKETKHQQQRIKYDDWRNFDFLVCSQFSCDLLLLIALAGLAKDDASHPAFPFLHHTVLCGEVSWLDILYFV